MPSTKVQEVSASQPGWEGRPASESRRPALPPPQSAQPPTPRLTRMCSLGRSPVLLPYCCVPVSAWGFISGSRPCAAKKTIFCEAPQTGRAGEYPPHPTGATDCFHLKTDKGQMYRNSGQHRRAGQKCGVWSPFYQLFIFTYSCKPAKEVR